MFESIIDEQYGYDPNSEYKQPERIRTPTLSTPGSEDPVRTH
jgi:hypothetical protein